MHIIIIQYANQSTCMPVHFDSPQATGTYAQHTMWETLAQSQRLHLTSFHWPVVWIGIFTEVILITHSPQGPIYIDFSSSLIFSHFLMLIPWIICLSTLSLADYTHSPPLPFSQCSHALYLHIELPPGARRQFQ